MVACPYHCPTGDLAGSIGRSNGPIQFPTLQSGLQTRMTTDLPATEVTINSSIHLVGIWIEAFGVLIIVAGIIWSTYRYIHWGNDGWNYD